MKTVREILIEARALIADPARWTKGALARSAMFAPVPPWSPFATCWCAEGASYYVGGQDGGSRAIAAMDSVSGVRPATTNDRGGHADVLALYDRAIAAEST